MHERPARKIRLYTRFFNYANFRLPLSTFLVDILRHFRINISQLSVIGAAKNDHFFWVDDFACPARFSWHTAKNVTRDPAPVATDFNVQDYATLVVHPSPFRKFLKEFLCLVRLSRHYTLDEETYPRFLDKNREGGYIDIFAFIHTPNPTKLCLTVLKASVDKLFDEGGSGNQTEQRDSIGGGQGANIQPVVEVAAPVQPRCQGKRKSVVVDAGGDSHPPKKLREDHGTPGGTSVGGKSLSTIKRLLARAVLNAEVGVAAIPTLSFVTTSVSSTSEREAEDHTDSVAEPNLHTIGASQRSSVPLMTTVTNVAATVDPTLVVKEKTAIPSPCSADSFSDGGADPNTSIFFRSFWQRLSCWCMTNGSRLDDGRVCREMVDEFAPPKFFAFVREMEHGQLYTEFNVGAARQMYLSAEVRMRAEYNVKERRRLKYVVEKQDELLKRSLRDEVNALKERNTILEKERNALDVKATGLEALAMDRDRELTNLNIQLTSVKSQNDNLVDQVHELKISSTGLQEKLYSYENLTERLKEFLDAQLKIVNDKFDKLYADFVEIALHLEEKFYSYILTTISGRRWLLTHDMELAIAKCLNLPEYLSALGAAIGKAIEKGMQDELSAGITRGKEGRTLTDVAAHNPSAEDARIEAVMNVLRLEEPLADKLGLNELQPHVDQLMVPIHHSSDKVVIGATALSLALDVSSIRVRKIKENIANQRSVLHDVFVPLSELLYAAVLTGTEGTSNTVPATVDTTTTLSTIFAAASTIAPISVDDYEVVGTDDQAGADGNAEPFPNVDDAELNIP
ncbi:hypothetical protein Tco_1266134 [Tanacetum coccineum]